MSVLFRRCQLPKFEIKLDLLFATVYSLCLQVVTWFAMATPKGPDVIPKCRKESQFAIAQKKPYEIWNEPLSLESIGEALPELKPVSGFKAERGRRNKMEDTCTIKENYLELSEYCSSLKSRFPYGMDDEFKQMLSKDKPTLPQSRDEFLRRDVFHFYGIYDGHGGTEASEHCASRMHDNLRSAWNNLRNDECSSDDESCMNNPCGRINSDDIVEIFEKAYKTTDDEFKETNENAAVVGTTAVTVLVGKHNIIAGYCGDSRAVLCRNKRAFPLTIDHKPEREDESDRVQKAGGQVLYFNGPRVMGLLAMSRAIGDQSLRPYVIPTPDVCVIPRSPEDEVLVLASDGLWDVLSNQETCTLALKCLNRAKEKQATPEDAARLTATVLTRAAMDRGSRDNVTVIVVDLRTGGNFVQSVPSSENDSPCNVPDPPAGFQSAH